MLSLPSRVALKFEAAECDFQSTGFFTSPGIIDQRRSKTYGIARESDCVLESDPSTQAVLS
jgi:hypothetical protein